MSLLILIFMCKRARVLSLNITKNGIKMNSFANSNLKLNISSVMTTPFLQDFAEKTAMKPSLRPRLYLQNII